MVFLCCACNIKLLVIQGSYRNKKTEFQDFSRTFFSFFQDSISSMVYSPNSANHLKIDNKVVALNLFYLVTVVHRTTGPAELNRVLFFLPIQWFSLIFCVLHP